MAFGKHLRSLRMQRKLTQEEVAHRANIHVTYLSGVERGIRNPSLKNIRSIAQALGVAVCDLFAFELRKDIRDITERVKAVAEAATPYITHDDIPKDDLTRLIKDLETQMKSASRELEFEKAALLRDQIIDLRKVLAG